MGATSGRGNGAVPKEASARRISAENVESGIPVGWQWVAGFPTYLPAFVYLIAPDEWCGRLVISRVICFVPDGARLSWTARYLLASCSGVLAGSLVRRNFT